ncbi:hypothetical protein ACFWVC_01335 [Streptomyces sp. NPDC058691]|uniref:hypothetical protein n=1 Tax=Streptomyces sp. NPDC058691 TaxID=3346601 RepID=UPI003665D6A8
MPTLADKGYIGAGERTAAELKERWRAFEHISLRPSRIGDMARAARVLDNHWK